MPIESAQVLDAIGINENTGNIEMFVEDNEIWDDEGQHIELLQDKLYMYLHFVLEGQIFEVFSNPEDMNRTICFVVKFRHKISENMREFLEFYKISLMQHKILLCWIEENAA
ncbi:hypothetical protein OKW22_000073 [Bacilli bacterium PM5-3]|nr:hypothetical protein [Bacilli bacterium PM5-3]